MTQHLRFAQLKTVLFDLDGTLLDTEPDFSIILNTLLTQHQRPLVSSTQVRQTVSEGARALIKLGFAINEKDELFSTLLNNFLDLYAEQIEHSQSQLFRGIETLLQRIKAEGKQWGIVTNKPSRFTLPIIHNFPALQSASCIICPDHLNTAKPDPEGLLLACRQASCEPTQAVYVGDHRRDIDAGINACMPTIAVQWGYHNGKTLIEDWQASKIVASPEEIQSYLFN